MIDKDSKMPLHKQAEHYLRQLIEQEEYKNGKLLPAELELSQQMDISRNTLRQAINTLVSEGLLLRKPGYGTKVVRKGTIGGINNWQSFSQEMQMLGIEVKNYELHVRYELPSLHTQSFFNLDNQSTEQCVVLERVRGNQEYPFVYFISYFNPRIGLTSDESFNQPLYNILEKKYKVVVKTSKEEISARIAGDEIAKKLNISASDPI